MTERLAPSIQAIQYQRSSAYYYRRARELLDDCRIPAMRAAVVEFQEQGAIDAARAREQLELALTDKPHA